MQKIFKVFTVIIAILFVIVCAYYLSFSWATSNQEEIAAAKKENGERYLDSMKNEKVWMFKTLQECYETQLGLGLDLKGGMNLMLEVSVPDIVKSLAEENAEDPAFQAAYQAALDKKDNADFVSTLIENYTQGGKRSLAGIFATSKMPNVKQNSSDADVEKEIRAQIASAVDNSYNVISSRIDRFGVAQPNIQKLEGGNGRIMVELPGVKEPERVTKLLTSSANLEFWETWTATDVAPYLQQINAKLSGDTKAEAKTDAKAEADTTAAADKALAATDSSAKPAAEATTPSTRSLFSLLTVDGSRGGAVVGYAPASNRKYIDTILTSPEAKQILSAARIDLKWGAKAAEGFKGDVYELYAIRLSEDGKAPLSGDAIVDAKADYDPQSGRPLVSMTMDNDGARIWAELTKKNIGHAVAIVLDGVVYSAPNVQTEITGGRSQITGNFTTEDTRDLASVLNGGKMTVPLNVVQADTVGPSLGQESINKGIVSCIVAFVLLMIYMCLLYGFKPGMVANCALIINLFLIVGCLASFQAALTMSGIAGMVLTLGMAVDANVLVFERIKEELRGGKKIKSAISDGYGNALSAIIDSNLTSIITGIILYVFGTGAIRGFAITLIIGLIASVFTAVLLTRIVFEAFVNSDKWQNLTFTTAMSRNFLQNTKFKFMSAYKVSFVVWAVAIVICIGFFAVKGLNAGIDFAGGRNYTVLFDKQVNTEEIKNDVTATIQASDPNANVSILALGADGNKVRISTTYKINTTEADTLVDSEIETLIYQGLNAGGKLAPGVTEATFKDRDNQQGGSIISSQKVNNQVAMDTTKNALIAVALALVAIFLYIFIRFRKVAFSVGSTVGLICDAVLIIGTFSIFWGILPISLEVDQTFIAAVLTCIGYSINDKVVIFDRIREYIKLYPKRDRQELFNTSLNTTLARTINTSTTTLLVLLCIFFLGGDSIRSFAFAMILGVIYGTCSSIFISAPLAFLVMGRKIKQEEAEVVAEA